jgi:hypothetical protein
MKKLLILSITLGVLVMGGYARAVPYGFDAISHNNGGDVAIAEAQLFVNVTDASTVDSNLALFTFYNTGPQASSITDIYFYDEAVLGTGSITTNSIGVKFSEWAAPPNLPGYPYTSMFSADADKGVSNGVDSPVEYLGITFNLNGDFSDVIAAINSMDLRIGIHVQGFDGGGSESLINSNNPVPEPATLVLLGSGLIGLAGIARRQRI